MTNKMNRLRFMTGMMLGVVLGIMLGTVGIRASAHQVPIQSAPSPSDVEACKILSQLNSPSFTGHPFGITVRQLAAYLATIKNQDMHVLGQNDTETWGLTFDDLEPLKIDTPPYKNAGLVLIPGNKAGRTKMGNQSKP